MEDKVREIQRSSSLGQYYITIVYWSGKRTKFKVHSLENRNIKYNELKKEHGV